MNLQAYIPIIGQLKDYSKKAFYTDAFAGLTVGFMIVPQGMAYAMIAGLPPIYGLYAALVPLVVYALLGTSRQLSVGPVAMDSLLTASSVSVLAEWGTDTFIALAMTLAFMVGLIQFVMGMLRLGFLVNFLSRPVISGFTSAAALIIAFSQLKHLLGISLSSTNDIFKLLYESLTRIGELHGFTFLIGIVGIVIIYVLKKFNKRLPAPLILVALSVLLSFIFGFETHNVSVVGDIPSGLPSFGFSHLTLGSMQQLMIPALTIAMISFMESYAVAKSIQSKHKSYRLDADQELRALGASNMSASLFQGFSVAGGFSRSAVNDQAGAQTGIASIVTALIVVLTLLFLTPLFYFLPKTILASIIMVAVVTLIDYKEAKLLWKVDKKDFWMLIVSFIATLSLGIVQGIVIGVVMSLILLVYNSSRPHVAVLGKIPNSRIYRNIERFDNVLTFEGVSIIRFDSPLYYNNIEYFREHVENVAFGKPMKAVIIHSESINTVDSSALNVIRELYMSLHDNGVRLIFTGVIGPVRDLMQRSGLFDLMGSDCFYLTVDEAVNSVLGDNYSDEKSDKYVMQHNTK